MSEASSDNAVRDLQRVLEVTRALSATQELDELLALIVEKSRELLGVERATLFRYIAAQNQLVARIATGVPELVVPADRGFCGEAVRTGRTIIIPDAYADERHNREVDQATGFHTRNIMSVPLRGIENQLVGVLQVLNKHAGAFTEYDVELAETLGAQAGVAIQRATLIEHYLEKQEMEQAMQIARDIQRGLLPEGPPDVARYDIAGRSEPADETGGDTFDFLSVPGGKSAFLVADATGHGIGPALVIAEMRAMLRACVERCPDEKVCVGDVLQTVNRLLTDDLQGGTFVTCFLGMLDPEANVLRYASAGHGPLLFYHAGDDAFTEVSATSLPLAVLDDTRYDEIAEVRMGVGDMAIITTDGVFEAMDREGEQFGTDRLTDLLRKHRDEPTEAIIERIYRAVHEFAAGQPQADDITAILIKRVE